MDRVHDNIGERVCFVKVHVRVVLKDIMLDLEGIVRELAPFSRAILLRTSKPRGCLVLRQGKRIVHGGHRSGLSPGHKGRRTMAVYRNGYKSRFCYLKGKKRLASSHSEELTKDVGTTLLRREVDRWETTGDEQSTKRDRGKPRQRSAGRERNVDVRFDVELGWYGEMA